MQTLETFWENPLLPFTASLRQLQLLQVKYAEYEPTAMSSSEMSTVWSNYDYSKYNAKSLNKLQLFLCFWLNRA